MTSTNTNKQPLFIDRPLFDHALLTTQIAGSEAGRSFNVQGGQAPALLVDMDATLSDDNNSGGVGGNNSQLENDNVALSQKNHRLAKELVSCDFVLLFVVIIVCIYVLFEGWGGDD